MFNAQRLLGTMIGTGLGGKSHHSLPTAHGRGTHGTGSGGGLMGAIGSMLGGGRGGRSSGLGRGVAGAGAAMVLGQLAMRYMQNRDGRQEAAAGADGDGATGNGAIGDEQALRMIRAMVASAHADGRIDEDERRQIMGRIGEAGASEDDRNFLEREIQSPASIDMLVQGVHDPEEKAEIYAAALMAVDADTEAERSFLNDLSGRLGLSPQERGELHRDMGMPELR
ncbi:MAG TPA: tellurite resistance TerB family protein [Alphaproteobacteria bacterium]|nr:tellurite resistance TerB family protein [Alphaproteobacteria bacterium]